MDPGDYTEIFQFLRNITTLANIGDTEQISKSDAIRLLQTCLLFFKHDKHVCIYSFLFLVFKQICTSD